MAGTRLFPNALELRAVAARSSMERIEQDRAGVGSKLKPLLDHIRTHLFSPGLNVQALKRACGVRDNSVSTAFGRAIGLPPRPYIEARRLETAERLLRETALPVHQIGDLVGFSSEAVFYRAFRRWRGEGPRQYRLGVQDGAAPPAAEALRPEAVQRALRGKASAKETEALIQGLTAARESNAPAPAPSAASRTAEPAAAEPISPAEELWNELRALGPEAKRERARSLGRLDRDLAELLFVKSRTEGRGNRAHGVHIAQLAVDCLYPGGQALEGIDQAELATLRARAYGWLGNANRLAFELDAARTAFDVARRLLPAEADAAIVSELLELESSLCYYEARFEEATALLDRAERLLRASAATNDAQRLARIQLQRSRTVLEEGNAAGAEEALERALLFLAKGRSPYLEVKVYEMLTYVRLRRGRYKQAAVLLPALVELSALQGLPASRPLWMTGLAWQGLGDHASAVDALVRARAIFVAEDDRLDAGVVSLDLALSQWHLGRGEQALTSCAEAIPLLQSNRQHKELFAAAGIVSGLVREGITSAEVLVKIRQHLERLCRDPRARPE